VKCIVTIGVLCTFIILISGCNNNKENSSPPPYYPSLAVEKTDNLEIYQLYTSQFSNLTLSQKLLCYHLYLACIIGQKLVYDPIREVFQLTDISQVSEYSTTNILNKLIMELELSIEYSDGETKNTIWLLISFLQSGRIDNLSEYYLQLTKTFNENVIFCIDFSGTEDVPYKFYHKSAHDYYYNEIGAFGGAILVEEIDNRVIGAEKLHYELLCATGAYGHEFDPSGNYYHIELISNSNDNRILTLSNLKAFFFQKDRYTNVDSVSYKFILPEPKLIRNKMGGITDVEMIHTLDFEGQMQRFEIMKHGQ